MSRIDSIQPYTVDIELIREKTPIPEEPQSPTTWHDAVHYLDKLVEWIFTNQSSLTIAEANQMRHELASLRGEAMWNENPKELREITSKASKLPIVNSI